MACSYLVTYSQASGYKKAGERFTVENLGCFRIAKCHFRLGELRASAGEPICHWLVAHQPLQRSRSRLIYFCWGTFRRRLKVVDLGETGSVFMCWYSTYVLLGSNESSGKLSTFLGQKLTCLSEEATKF